MKTLTYNQMQENIKAFEQEPPKSIEDKWKEVHQMNKERALNLRKLKVKALNE